jgi:apolipoprotein N-acyltransferase
MEVVSLIFFIFALICLLIVLFLMNSYSRRIEKIAVIFACCGFFSFGAGIILRPSQQQEDNQYTITAVAEDTNYLKTKDGNIWRVNKDLEVGKEYEVKFDSKGTDNVIDDEILEIN